MLYPEQYKQAQQAIKINQDQKEQIKTSDAKEFMKTNTQKHQMNVNRFGIEE